MIRPNDMYETNSFDPGLYGWLITVMIGSSAREDTIIKTQVFMIFEQKMNCFELLPGAATAK